MRKFSTLIFVLPIIIILFSFNFIEAQVIRPRARGTPSNGPTIDQAQKEDYTGPKARVAVMKSNEEKVCFR